MMQMLVPGLSNNVFGTNPLVSKPPVFLANEKKKKN